MKNRDILKRPLVTEKSMRAKEKGKYVFEVAKEASKKQIKHAVKEIFGADVESVRTMIMPGKKRRSGRMRHESYQSSWKKAVIQLAEGESLDIFEEG
jgi:large subunit ribosomal protein L23